MKSMISPRRNKIAVIIFCSLALLGCVPDEKRSTLERQQMVEQQLAARGITDQRVLAAMLKVKRHLFVPIGSRHLAYRDHPVPIGYDQTISQPFIVALMTQEARLSPTDKVLEIGTGSGYQAAILAEMISKVYTIEILKPLAEEAQRRLKKLGYHHIFVKQGDGYQGWLEFAPYDAIIVTAAPPEIPPKLIEQLTTGGRLIVPVGATYQELLRITKTQEGIKQERLLSVRFVPMVSSP